MRKIPVATALILGVALAPWTSHAAGSDARRVVDSDDWVLEDAGRHTRFQELNLSLALWPDTIGLAVWYDIPVAHDGILPRVNDSISIEFGGLWMVHRGYWYGGNNTYFSFIAAVGPRWDLYLTRSWQLFFTLKLGLEFGVGPYDPDWFVPGVSLGAEYKLSRPSLLRLELGYPAGFSIGISFDLGG